MIIKCISCFKVYKYLQKKIDNDDNENKNKILYGYIFRIIDPNTNIWIWYIIHKIFLQISLGSMSVVVFNYWLLVYSGPNHFPDENNALSSIQTHGLSCFILWIDYLCSAERLYYKSCIWPILMAFIYTMWTIIFECTLNMNEENDPFLYEVYNWSEHQILPTILFFISCILLSIWTWIAVVIKNFILMKSGIAQIKNKYTQILKDNIHESDQEALI